jgi:uncharacterized protein (TIGR02996 family)
MSDGDALFAAILARPDADVPRLAYADWLEEFGTERDRARAELIRVQIEIAAVPDASRTPADVRFLELRTRESSLLAKHMDDWLAALRAPGAPLQSGEAHAQFRRGFVEIVWLPAGVFVQRAGALFARAPVRELRVTRGVIGEISELVGGAYFARLHALDLSDRRLGDDVARVLARRASAALRVLRLSGCGLTDAGAALLARGPWELAELDVRHNEIGATGLRALRDRFGERAVRAGE